MTRRKMCFLVFIFLVSVLAGTPVIRTNEAVYKTQTLGSFIIDEINGVVCPSCDPTPGVLDLPSFCAGEVGSHIRTCTKNSSITGTVLNSLNTWDIDFIISVYIAEADVNFVGEFNTFSYSWDSSARINHPTALIQYDGNDGSFCLKGEDGMTGGLGGIDLSQGGTQNAIALQSSNLDQQVTYDVTIYDTFGNSERQFSVITRTCFTSSFSCPTNPFTFAINSGDVPVTLIPFTNMSIFSNVDAIEIKLSDNPQSALGSSLDAGIVDFPTNLGITTGFVDGCRFEERFASPEMSRIRGGGLGCGLPPDPFPQRHSDYGTCLENTFLPFLTSKNTWMDLPYGNTFEYTDLTNYSSIVYPMGFTTQPMSIDIGIFNIDRRSSIGFFPTISTMDNNIYPIDNLGLLQMDFAKDGGNGLFRNITVSAIYEEIFFGGACTSPVSGYEITPLDVNLMPLSAPIPMTLTSTTPINGFLTYSYSTTYDAGSNVLRGVLVDFSTFNCTIPPTMSTIFALPRFSVTNVVLEADGNCHRPATRPPCRVLKGFSFIDNDADGIFDDSVDAYTSQSNLILVDPDTPNPSTDYATSSILNGTYYTECYDIGSVLQVTVLPPPGVGITTNNNPQLYTVTDDCVNRIPEVGFQNLHGVVFRVYNDLNNNGMYNLGEPGIPNIEFKITKIDEPSLGEMSFGTSDAMGNVLIPMVLGGNHTLEIIDTSTGPLFGFTQTEGMDPTNVTLALQGGVQTTITNFGYFRPPQECSSGTSFVIIDPLNDADLSVTMTNETMRSVNVTRNTGVGGLVTERNMRLTATSPMWMSSFTRMFTNGIDFMVYMNTSAELFFQWDGPDGSLLRDDVVGLGGLDFTNGGLTTAITFRVAMSSPIASLFNATLTVGDTTQRIETQTRPFFGRTGAFFLTFFFADETIYQNVTFMEFTLSNVDVSETAAANVYISSVSTQCILCEQIISFNSEQAWTLGQSSESIATPFQALNRNTIVMPFAHYTQLLQTSYTIANVLGSPALMTANKNDLLQVDFNVASTGTDALRRIQLDVRIQDTSLTGGTGCNGTTPQGPSVTFYDVDGNLITFAQEAGPLSNLGGGVYGTTFVFDAAANIIKRMNVDYSQVTCRGAPAANVTYGLDNIRISTDGPCGGQLGPLIRQQRTTELLPLIIMSPFILVLVLLFIMCAGAGGYVYYRQRCYFNVWKSEFPYKTTTERGVYVKMGPNSLNSVEITRPPVELVLEADGSLTGPKDILLQDNALLVINMCNRSTDGASYLQLKSQDGTWSGPKYLDGLMIIRAPTDQISFLVNQYGQPLARVRPVANAPSFRRPYPIYVTRAVDIRSVYRQQPKKRI